MDLVKAQLDRIQRQLNGLTPSQRMLTVALVAIMIMTLVWWGRYAGEAEMEPVFNSAVSPDDLGRITTELTAKGIKYAVSGDKILVPSDRKIEAVAALSYSRMMPRDNKGGFEEMLDKMNPFLPTSTNDLMFNRGKEITVAQILRNFPDVADAEVMIDPTQRTVIGANIEPSATVTITMRPGIKASQQIVNAAADVVEGAQAGLNRSKIKVVINGMPHRVQDTENNDVDGSEQLELQQKAEVRLADKVKDQFSYIAGLMVSVTVKLNTTTIQEKSLVYDPKTSLQKTTEERTDTEENTSPAPASGEPGVTPNTSSNTAVAIPAGAGGGPSSTHEHSESKFANFVSQKEQVSHAPAGNATPVGATVRVPLSYFAAVYTRQHPDVKDPTDAMVQGLVGQEMPKIKEGVLKCVGLVAKEDVSVETYADPAPVLVASPQAASMPVTLMLGGHAREIALGGLALLSLFVVLMMVRNSSPAPLVAAAAPIAVAKNLDADELVAGSAGEGGTTLSGMELDDDAVRAQQMVDQVSTMVKENPEGAATLVKRWMNRT